MDRTRPTVNQLNIVSSNPEASIAFYRRLGLDIPDRQVWRTATGVHHVSAEDAGIDFDLDSTAFAQLWNSGWRGRKDLAGRIVLGLRVASRAEVDRLYGEMTAAAITVCRRPGMPSGARAMPWSRTPTESRSAS